jgi:excisionase family DNA binding protein
MNRRKAAPSGLSPQENSEIMTMAEVAKLLKCHPSTVYRLVRISDLPAFRLGSDWRFLHSEIDKWIERQRRPYGPRKVLWPGRGKRGPKPKK